MSFTNLLRASIYDNRRRLCAARARIHLLVLKRWCKNKRVRQLVDHYLHEALHVASRVRVLLHLRQIRSDAR